MLNQDEYNKEYGEFVDDNNKRGIKLPNVHLQSEPLEMPDISLDITPDKMVLKKEKPRPIVKEFKPKKKTDDEPIW